MALPGHRLSKYSKRVRASHFALKKVKLFKCPKCQKPVLPHIACKNCGYYKGRDVLKIQTKIDKKAKKSLKKKKEQQGSK